jgi:hypothetical protein
LFPYDSQVCTARFTSFKYQVPNMIMDLGKISVHPDFYANSGIVLVSFFQTIIDSPF